MKIYIYAARKVTRKRLLQDRIGFWAFIDQDFLSHKKMVRSVSWIGVYSQRIKSLAKARLTPSVE